MTHVGQKISEARYRRGWDRGKLATEAGITIERLTAIEDSAAPVDPYLPDVLTALGLAETVVIDTPAIVDFVAAVQRRIAVVPMERVLPALTACLDVLDRAATDAPPYLVRNLQIINNTGEIRSLDQGDAG